MPSPTPAFDVVFPWDHTLFRGVNAFARETGWLHGVMLAYASYGVVLFAGLLLVGWWVARSSGDLVKVAAALWAPVGALVSLYDAVVTGLVVSLVYVPVGVVDR